MRERAAEHREGETTEQTYVYMPIGLIIIYSYAHHKYIYHCFLGCKDFVHKEINEEIILTRHSAQEEYLHKNGWLSPQQNFHEQR